MTLVWLSPGLPADRTALAAALPSNLALFSLPSLDDPAALDALAVGSLCVATVFETELLNQLARRPVGVRLLVVGPPDRPSHLPPPPAGRVPDAMSPAASLSELAAAIAGAASAAPTATLTRAVPGADRPRLRSRLVAAGAVLAGLAIGGIVIGATEGSSSASANRAPIGGVGGNFGGGNFGPRGGGNLPGGAGGNFPGGPGGQTGTGTGTGSGTGRGAIEQEIVACLRQQGFTGSVNQLRQRAADPQLRQAFATCLQQLGNSSSQLSGRP